MEAFLIFLALAGVAFLSARVLGRLADRCAGLKDRPTGIALDAESLRARLRTVRLNFMAAARFFARSSRAREEALRTARRSVTQLAFFRRHRANASSDEIGGMTDA
jgi:hypothetical protein